MPDFDTRKPQEPNEPSRLRIALIASKLRTLLITGKPRIPLIAHRLRSLLIANKLRSLLIGGVILLFVGVAVTVGLPIYSSSGIGNWQQDGQIVFTLDG